jgi:hypothetical protein
MDPYLERHWRDVQLALIIAARESLDYSLPPDLVARVDERTYVEEDKLGGRIKFEPEPVTERFIEVRKADNGHVVTAIEFVSAANKKRDSAAWDAYLRTRKLLVAASSNVVEIDLTRGGDWIGLMDLHSAPAHVHQAYRATVRLADRAGRVEYYPISLRQRLQMLAIPLRLSDKDVLLDLQELLDRAYESGRYGSTDYRVSCDPPLDAEDAEWADQLLRGAGRR